MTAVGRGCIHARFFGAARKRVNSIGVTIGRTAGIDHGIAVGGGVAGARRPIASARDDGGDDVPVDRTQHRAPATPRRTESRLARAAR